MYQLIHRLAASEPFKRRLPVFLVAFPTAELFCKFHSFALACAAFLVTWSVLDAVVQRVLPRPAASS